MSRPSADSTFGGSYYADEHERSYEDSRTVGGRGTAPPFPMAIPSRSDGRDINGCAPDDNHTCYVKRGWRFRHRQWGNMARGFYQQYQQGRGLALGPGIKVFEMPLPRGSYIAVVKTVLGNPGRGVFYALGCQLGNRFDHIEAYTSPNFETDVVTLTVGATLRERASLRLDGFSAPVRAFTVVDTAVSVVEVDSINFSPKFEPADVTESLKSLLGIASTKAVPKDSLRAYQAYLKKIAGRLVAAGKPATTRRATKRA